MAQALSLFGDIAAPARAHKARTRRPGAPAPADPATPRPGEGADLFAAAEIRAADQAPAEISRQRMEQFRVLYRGEGNPKYGIAEDDFPPDLRPFVSRFVREGWCSRAEHCAELVILVPELRLPNDLTALLARCREEMRQAEDMNALYRARDRYESRHRDEFGADPFWEAWTEAIVERGPRWLLTQESHRRRRRGGRRLFDSEAAHRQVMQRLTEVSRVGEQEAFLRRLRHGRRWFHPTRGSGLRVQNVSPYSPNTFIVPLMAKAAGAGDTVAGGALLEQVSTVPLGGYGANNAEAALRAACAVSARVRGRPCRHVGGPRSGRALLLPTKDGAVLVCAPRPGEGHLWHPSQ